MSALTKIVSDMIEQKLKGVHVAFLAQTLSVRGNKAKIQPLGLTREYGGTAQKQSVITGVHISRSAQYKFESKEITYAYNSAGDTKTQSVVVPTPIKAGDVVLCVCCDRNIAAALNGKNELPPVGSHSKSDCVIVSII